MAAEVVEGGGQEDESNTLQNSDENMDMSIVANRSELSSSLLGNNEEKIYKLGFSLNDLYKLSLQFYKKEKEELTLSYFDKVQLVALWKQVSSGKFSQSKSPEIGYFDVIGNDRRKAWEALQDMEEDVARQQFSELLELKCPAYVPFVEGKKREVEAELERKRLEEERIRLEEEEKERLRKEEEERIRLEELERVRLALEAEKLRLQEEEEKRQEEEAAAKLAAELAAAAAAAAEAEVAQAQAAAVAANSVEDTSGVSTQESEEKTETSHVIEEATESINAVVATPVSPSLETPHVNGSAGTGREIAPASLWTRPKLQEFINHVKRDASSVLVVGRGETVTIRVPTHELGSCLFWEFATEYYDVGFGVYFEWTQSKSPAISVNVNESDEEAQPVEVAKPRGNEQQIIVNENEDNLEVIDKPNTDEVLPVLRRNSQEQVIVGSHMYPGQGIYLLKFDNSYSLLRSKTLYYRVYYTK